MKPYFGWVLLAILIFAGCEPDPPVQIPEKLQQHLAVPSKDVNYDTYTGCRDWYRVPLKYPYQLMAIDYHYIQFKKLEEGGDITNPNQNTTTLVDDIEEVALEEQFIVLKCKKSEYDWEQKKRLPEVISYKLYIYENGDLIEFSTIDELKKYFTNSYRFTGDLTFYNFDTLYKYFEHISSQRSSVNTR